MVGILLSELHYPESRAPGACSSGVCLICPDWTLHVRVTQEARVQLRLHLLNAAGGGGRGEKKAGKEIIGGERPGDKEEMERKGKRRRCGIQPLKGGAEQEDEEEE